MIGVGERTSGEADVSHCNCSPFINRSQAHSLGVILFGLMYISLTLPPSTGVSRSEISPGISYLINVLKRMKV